MLRSLTSDLQVACRRLRRMSLSSFVAVITVGLGVVLNAAILGALNSLFFHSAAIPTAPRLVAVGGFTSGQAGLEPLSDGEYDAIRKTGAAIFEAYLFHDIMKSAVTVGARSEMVTAELVSGPYFQTFGTRPLYGRLLEPADDSAGETVPVVLSENFWHRFFSADPAVIGRAIRLNGLPAIVVGVAPSRFRGTFVPTLFAMDAWMPVRIRQQIAPLTGAASLPGPHFVLATLKPDVSVSQADAVVRAIGRQDERHSTSPMGHRLGVVPGREGIMPSELGTTMGTVAGIAFSLTALVLIIACANLANLVMARTLTRTAELTVRRALGANRMRLAQLVLVETAVLAVLGGVVGLALASALVRLLPAVAPHAFNSIHVQFAFSLDSQTVLLASVLVGLATALVGLGPIRLMSRSNLLHPVASGGLGGATSTGRRARTALVAVQVGFAVVLLIVSTCVLQSNFPKIPSDVGFDVERTVTATIDPSAQRIDDARAQVAFDEFLRAAVGSVGVVGAAATSWVPATPSFGEWSVKPTDASRIVYASGAAVSPTFFEVLRIPLIRGRVFSAEDQAGSGRVAIVTKSLAETLWPGQTVIGQRIALTGSASDRTAVVVGVSGDVMDTTFTPRARAVFVPLSQYKASRIFVVARSAGPAEAILASFRRSMAGAVPGVAASDVRTVREAVEVSGIFVQRAAITFLIGLAVVGFAIALVGVGAVSAFSVSQQTREFGVRRALGATSGEIYGLVLRQSFRTLMFGLVPGLIAALLGAVAATKLSGDGDLGLITAKAFILVPVGMLVVGLAACYGPARRAVGIAPLDALREL